MKHRHSCIDYGSPDPDFYEAPDELENIQCCVCDEWVCFDDTVPYDRSFRYQDRENRICIWCQKENGSGESEEV